MIHLACYCSDINKYLPGPHFDPPSKDKVKTLMQVLFCITVLLFNISVYIVRP